MLAKGYTMLEMLIVILLLGLVTALALPRLDRLFDSIRLAYERDEVMEAIGALVFEAHSRQSDFVLDTYPARDYNSLPLRLPDGWYLKTKEPIRFRASGVCSGGVIRVENRNQVDDVRLVPPLCQPEI